MSHKDGYELSYRQIEAETGLGRHAIQAATKNLEDLGWLTTERIIQPDGRFGGKAWIINDFTSVTNSTVEPAAVENLTHFKKTNSKKTNSKNITTFSSSDESQNQSAGELIPDSWMPKQRHYDMGNLLHIDVNAQASLFRTYAVRRARRQKNWDTAFTNWLKKSVAFQRQREVNPQIAGGKLSNAQQAIEMVKQMQQDQLGELGQ
jgi:hypothetical protein